MRRISRSKSPMFAKKIVDATRYAALPTLLIVFGAVTLYMRDSVLARVFPHYFLFLVFFAMITLERVYSYRRAVSQRHMIWRDLMSTAVQWFVAGGLMAAVVLRILHFTMRVYLGRGLLFGSSTLGPFWVQVPVVFVLSSLWGYGMHRFQHRNEFLWKLHGYHHSVTHIQTSNLYVSNPFDWALRSVLGGLLLSVVGFNPLAVVVAGVLGIYADFSHCGADVRGGWLNYFFNTPEVHRWHHSVEFPDDEKFRYGCNFGVSTTFWDVIFGTFYLPKDAQGLVLAPVRMGHPSGYADESNYLKMLLGVRAFPSVMRLFGSKKDLSPSLPSDIAAE